MAIKAGELLDRIQEAHRESVALVHALIDLLAKKGVLDLRDADDTSETPDDLDVIKGLQRRIYAAMKAEDDKVREPRIALPPSAGAKRLVTEPTPLESEVERRALGFLLPPGPPQRSGEQ